MADFDLLERFIRGSIVVGLFIGLSTLILMQAVKPFARSFVQARVTRRWFSGHQLIGIEPQVYWHHVGWLKDHPLLTKLPLEAPANEAFYYINYGRFYHEISILARRFVSNEILMRLISNSANSVLESPYLNTGDFLSLTSSAPIKSQFGAIALDRVREMDPVLFAQIVELNPGKEGVLDPTALAISAIRTDIASAVERGLDDLQARLSSAWRSGGRLLAIGIGIAMAFLSLLASGTLDLRSLIIFLFPLSIPAAFWLWTIYVEWLSRKFLTYSRYEGILAWFGVAVAVVAVLAAGWVTADVLEDIKRPAELPSVLFIGAIAGLLASMVHDSLQALLPRRG